MSRVQLKRCDCCGKVLRSKCQVVHECKRRVTGNVFMRVFHWKTVSKKHYCNTPTCKRR